MKKYILPTILLVGLIAGYNASAQVFPVLRGSQGGTNTSSTDSGNVGKPLVVSSTSPLVWRVGDAVSSGGGGLASSAPIFADAVPFFIRGDSSTVTTNERLTYVSSTGSLSFPTGTVSGHVTIGGIGDIRTGLFGALDIVGNTGTSGAHVLTLTPTTATTTTGANLARGIGVDISPTPILLDQTNVFGFIWPTLTEYQVSSSIGDTSINYVVAQNPINAIDDSMGGLLALFVAANTSYTTSTSGNAGLNSYHSFGSNPVFDGRDGGKFNLNDMVALEDFLILQTNGGGSVLIKDWYTAISDPIISAGEGVEVLLRNGLRVKDKRGNGAGDAKFYYSTGLQVEDQRVEERAWSLKSFDPTVEQFHAGSFYIGSGPTSTLAATLEIGSATTSLISSANFPATGTIEIYHEEKSGQHTIFEYTANNTSTNTLTLATTSRVLINNSPGSAFVKFIPVSTAQFDLNTNISSTVALRVTGVAGQSANLTEWRHDTSTLNSVVDANGRLGLQTPFPSSTFHSATGTVISGTASHAGCYAWYQNGTSTRFYLVAVTSTTNGAGYLVGATTTVPTNCQ